MRTLEVEPLTMQLQTASFNDHDRVMQIPLDKEANLNAQSEGCDYTL